MVSNKKLSLKKKKSLPKQRHDREPKTSATESQQHNEWVKFQQSISVSGFDTGQVTAPVRRSKRGGAKLQKKLERERLQRDGEPEPFLTGGEYAALRYNDEETQKLLAEAYANIPERGGRRGTRNLQRQKLRWKLVRKIHKKEKKWKIRAHFRRMEKRSKRVKSVLAVKEDAVFIREEEKEYRDKVMLDWYKISVMGEKLWPKIY
mmetsp:Transcript_6405/g.8065  ORF Transcript_6405/g.8065 Transcript_6405/m.8065 type:complete len:205 (+) Transcript_6405:205-819(+)